MFAHAGDYVNYITMEIITDELIRNVGLALLCVFVATMFLLAHLLIRDRHRALGRGRMGALDILTLFRISGPLK